MSASDLARAQRAEISDLLEQAGPDSPTLCEGWTTRDLAAHLVVRESRPDTALGILGGPLAQWTERVQNGAATEPYDKLVRLIRGGPPIWSAFRLPIVDGQANTIEYYVHAEDVRRAQEGWQPKQLDPELADFIWDRLKTAGRVMFNKVKTGVVLRRSDVRNDDGSEITARVRSGEDAVTLTGDPGELILIAQGRSQANVQIDGSEAATAAFAEAKLGD